MKAVRVLRADLRELIRGLGLLRARFPELGLGVSQCHTLLELEDAPRALGELAAVLQIDVSTASRNLATLERHGFVASARDADDPRRKLFRLTTLGRRKLRAVHRRGDRVMNDALAYLLPAEQRAVDEAIGALAKAVSRSQDPSVVVRRSRPTDNPAIALVIRGVLSELGMAHEGTAFGERETDEIHDVYARAGGMYLVVCKGGTVEGGGGLMPHGDRLCELKNLYFTPAVRGGGHARRLVNGLLRLAEERGFAEVFLETYSGWEAAAHLYDGFGFEPCARPAFYEGHSACDRYYWLRLVAP